MSSKPIHITEFDLKRLKDLIIESLHSQYRGSEYLDNLRAELDRAVIVSPQAISHDVITMNSIVTLIDLETNEEETYTLVFPENADIVQGKLSVLAPIGTALLGYEVGDVVEWDVPAGKRRLRVAKILYQPEAAGDFDL